MAHVLVIDDQPHLSLLVRIILESRDHTVIEAKNGRQALLHLDAAAYAVIVFDTFLTDMGGPAFVALVKQRFPTLPLIATSVYPEQGLLALEAGATLFLEKPFGYDLLVATLNFAVDRA